MSVSRRNFIKIGGLTALVCYAAPDKILGFPTQGLSDSFSRLSGSEFRNQIGSHFLLTGESTVIQSTLIEVRNSGRRKGECFTLVFSLLGDEAAAQSTYTVTHQTLGDFPMFLVPGKSAKGEPLLIAVVNRV